eukprot:5626465-Prorocentrum_lima.AAC.1
MTSSLVGSEMCIRDSLRRTNWLTNIEEQVGRKRNPVQADDGLREIEAVSYTHLTLPTICSV